MVRFAPLTATLLLLVLLAGGVQTVQAGLITDGDFEAFSTGLAPAGGTLSMGDWVFENNAGVNSGFPGNPGRAVRLESNGSPLTDPIARQTVSGLVIGQLYTLSWDYRLKVDFSSQGGPSFGVFLDTQTFGNALFLDDSRPSSYVSESVNFVATSNTHTFIFAGELDGRSNGANSTDISYYLDNVDLNSATAVPEPGSLAFWSAGWLCIIVFRKRQWAVA